MACVSSNLEKRFFINRSASVVSHVSFWIFLNILAVRDRVGGVAIDRKQIGKRNKKYVSLK